MLMIFTCEVIGYGLDETKPQNLNPVDTIHHLHWQVGCKRESWDLCILVRDWDCNDHPAVIDKFIILPTRELMKWFFKITLKILLTPSTVKFPIISHLVTTICVSGKIAFSHAPSLLISCARPCNKNTRLIFSMSHTELLYNNLLNMILFELIYAFNKNLVISYSYCFEANVSYYTRLKKSIGLFRQALGTRNCIL